MYQRNQLHFLLQLQFLSHLQGETNLNKCDLIDYNGTGTIPTEKLSAELWRRDSGSNDAGHILHRSPVGLIRPPAGGAMQEKLRKFFSASLRGAALGGCGGTTEVPGIISKDELFRCSLQLKTDEYLKAGRIKKRRKNTFNKYHK